MQDLPVLGVTMGDPAGIGPEVVLKAVNNPEVYRVCIPVIIGDARHLERAAGLLNLDISLRVISEGRWVETKPHEVQVIDLANVPDDLVLGKVQPKAGRAAVEYIECGVRLSERRVTAGIVTAPINKQAVNEAGYPHFSGHTEFIAELTRTKPSDVAMLLASQNVYISHVTTHVPLREVPTLVTQDRVLRVIELTYDTARRLQLTDKPIAVAGLNPHSGEHGLFGDEERLAIEPAIVKAKDAGVPVVGPVPPDTVFLRAARGEFSFVVAMYHDQGHIAAKLLGFEEGVNVTLGLPIIRTSVDHGTAFDIAGKGVADPTSMVRALQLAARMAAFQG